MKRNLSLCLLLVTAISIGCKKNDHIPTHLPVLDDTATVLLKDLVKDRLPSPYYHFVYDNNKYVTQVSFASDIDVYTLQYSNKRVTQMLNTKNNNHLEYTYTNNMVSLITEFSGRTGAKRWEYYFNYNRYNQLVQIKWFAFVNSGDTATPYRKVMLNYYADGNLESFDDFVAGTGSELAWSSRTQYKDYDNSTNVDGFSIFKNFFETLLFLPSIKVQKNNPGTEIITSIQNDYRITYQYQFENGLPVRKTGSFVQTRGGGKGQTTILSSRFSYY